LSVFNQKLLFFADHTFVSLITLNGNLARLSVQLRLNNPTSKTPSPITTPDTVGRMATPKEDEEVEEPIEKPELFCEVAAMSGPKCGLGVAELEGKLLVCGEILDFLCHSLGPASNKRF
jgi:influenza virus NS1A-binding protein